MVHRATTPGYHSCSIGRGEFKTPSFVGLELLHSGFRKLPGRILKCVLTSKRLVLNSQFNVQSDVRNSTLSLSVLFRYKQDLIEKSN